jgi:hypothetical protein
MVKPQMSQYGVIGYICEITFKDGTPMLKYYKDKGGDDSIQEFENLAQFCLERSPTMSGKSCGSGTCYCICCRRWKDHTWNIFIYSLGYLTASIAITFLITAFEFEPKPDAEN